MQNSFTCVAFNNFAFKMEYDFRRETGCKNYEIPILIGDGPEWAKIIEKSAKVRINNVIFSVNPLYNVATPGDITVPGVVTGCFSYKVGYAKTNTLGDNELPNVSDMAVSGFVAKTIRCTSECRGNGGNKIFETRLDTKEGEVAIPYTVNSKCTVNVDGDSGFMDVDQIKTVGSYFQLGKLVITFDPDALKWKKFDDIGGVIEGVRKNQRGYVKKEERKQELPQMQSGRRKQNPPPEPEYPPVGKDEYIFEPTEDGDLNLSVPITVSVEFDLERIPK